MLVQVTFSRSTPQTYNAFKLRLYAWLAVNADVGVLGMTGSDDSRVISKLKFAQSAKNKKKGHKCMIVCEHKDHYREKLP